MENSATAHNKTGENMLINCMQNEYVSIDHEQVITFLFNLKHNVHGARRYAPEDLGICRLIAYVSVLSVLWLSHNSNWTLNNVFGAGTLAYMMGHLLVVNIRMQTNKHTWTVASLQRLSRWIVDISIAGNGFKVNNKIKILKTLLVFPMCCGTKCCPRYSVLFKVIGWSLKSAHSLSHIHQKQIKMEGNVI